ncbi:MAG: DUF4347 domain-containing protein [Synechococcales cyanobacterium C42_A2020_086]|jgi:hypothetical protein|nr:DUF4347 domain-containing protein [Synechococcales cyanobacterium C42_A2020_086]
MTDCATALVCLDAQLHPRLAPWLLPTHDVVLLEPQRDGIEQITALLYRRQPLCQLHLIGIGSANSLQLGTAHLNLFTLERYGWQLQQWGEMLAAGAHLYLYGYPDDPPTTVTRRPTPTPAQGQSRLPATASVQSPFLQRLQLLTGANLAAFNLGATQTWELAATSGEVKGCSGKAPLPPEQAASSL